jgi:FkbM family methyltransferase
MKLRKLISGLRTRYFPAKERLVSAKLAGKDLVVIEGSVRPPDYDDAWFFYLVKESKVFFDIGANIGQTALLANIAGEPKRIVLVDPNPSALVYAAKNLLLNDLAANCSFYTAFVSTTTGERVKFYTVGVGSSGSQYASHAETARLVNSFFYVRTVTLDYLCEFYGLVPDLVKVDVEGAEYQVFKGAEKLAGKRGTRFIVEMHVTDECSMEQNMNNILGWGNEHGFVAYFLVDSSQITSGSQLSHRGRCHILVQPSDWEFPQYLIGVKEGTPLPIA